MKDFDIEYIKKFIIDHPTAKIYLGADSQRAKKKRVRFATVVIIHYDGCRGGRVFHDITYEKIIDAKLGRPFNRMMKEVAMVTDIYSQLEDVLIDRDFEIHLDISPNQNHGSNVAFGAAKGLVYGMVGVEPIMKPHSFASSCVADKYTK